jgi:hypothetical protein
MTRGRSTVTFRYSPRHRWAYVPTLGFMLVILAILLIDPGIIWSNPEPTTLRAATLLAAALAFGFAVAIGARWAAPAAFAVEGDALVATPLLGSPIRIPYSTIVDIRILPKTFMRGVPELVLQIDRRRPIAVRTDLGGYQQFEKALNRHLTPEIQARWKAARSA